MKPFKTNNMEIIRLSQQMFCFELPCLLIEKRSKKFTSKIMTSVTTDQITKKQTRRYVYL